MSKQNDVVKADLGRTVSLSTHSKHVLCGGFFDDVHQLSRPVFRLEGFKPI